MTAYLLTAAGVIFLTVIVSFIIPDGKLNKSVNFILRLVCIGVLLSPVTKLFDLTPTAGENLADYDYICEIYSQTQSEAVKKSVEENLNLQCDCHVSITMNDGVINEDGVTVYVEDCDSEKVKIIEEYLKSIGYINISVNEKGNRILQTK